MPAKTRRNRRAGNAKGGPAPSRRDEILEVAASVFAEKGFVSATVRDIGDVAGILSGSLYHHFESKEAMLEELLRPFLAELVDSYRAAVAAAPDPPDQLRNLIRRVYEIVARRRTMITILQNDRVYLRTHPRFSFVGDAENEVRSLWLEVIERGCREGWFDRDLDPRLVYRTIMGAALAAVRWWNASSDAELNELVEHQARFYLHGMAGEKVRAVGG